MSVKPYSILDAHLLVKLRGNSSEIDEILCDISNLHAEAAKLPRLSYHIHFYSMLLEFWGKDYLAAEKSSRAALAFPMAKNPEITTIYHSFFRGLVAFQLYRRYSDMVRLREGREMMDKFRGWTHVSKELFESKWLLLKAKYRASFEHSDDAIPFYQDSIKAAKSHGDIHELAIANELLGANHAAHDREDDYIQHIKLAYVCYSQWGATAIATKLLHDHDITMDSETERKLQISNNRKQPRGRDTEMS